MWEKRDFTEITRKTRERYLSHYRNVGSFHCPKCGHDAITKDLLNIHEERGHAHNCDYCNKDHSLFMHRELFIRKEMTLSCCISCTKERRSGFLALMIIMKKKIRSILQRMFGK